MKRPDCLTVQVVVKATELKASGLGDLGPDFSGPGPIYGGHSGIKRPGTLPMGKTVVENFVVRLWRAVFAAQSISVCESTNSLSEEKCDRGACLLRR